VKKISQKIIHKESWAKISGDTATIGITEESAKKVKEFVFIKLPKKGDKIKKGEKYVSLEAVKWSGHLTSPVSGEVIDVNESLEDNPSKLNKNPDTWIVKLKIQK